MNARKVVSLALSMALVGLTYASCNKKTDEPDVQEMSQDQRVQEQPAEYRGEQMEPGQMEPGMQGQGMQGQGMQGQGMQGQGMMGQGRGRGMGPRMMGRMGSGCPMIIQNAEVEMEQTDDGVALEFTTKDGNVDDIRQRARHLAQMYEMHAGRYHMAWRHIGAGEEGKKMKGKAHMADAGRMPAVKATVEEIESGARVVLVPKDEARLDTLRQHIQGHQQRMTSGQCWMLQESSEETEQ